MLAIAIVILFYASVFGQDGVVTSYYSNGNIESEISFKDSVRDGGAKFYYENGTIKEERTYTNGKVEGLVQVYSDSGKLKEVYVIEDGKRDGPTSLYDENGNYQSDIYYEEGKLIVPSKSEENFVSSDSKSEISSAESKDNTETKPKYASKKKSAEEFLPPEIEEEKFDNDPAFFTTLEVKPEPVGGMEVIYKKLIYPSEARENEITGTVKVQAFIDEFGEVMSAEIVEGIGYGCDNIARNAVYYARFKPGLQKGKPIRSMIIIPIEFKPDMTSNP